MLLVLMQLSQFKGKDKMSNNEKRVSRIHSLLTQLGQLLAEEIAETESTSEQLSRATMVLAAAQHNLGISTLNAIEDMQLPSAEYTIAVQETAIATQVHIAEKQEFADHSKESLTQRLPEIIRACRIDRLH